jgi:hypothetical protein
MDHGTQNARKLLLSWRLPFLLFGPALLIWMTVDELVPTVKHIFMGAPVIRIYAGSSAIPFCVAASIVTVTVLIFRAIPVTDEVIKKGAWWVTATWLSATLIMVVSLLVARPIQQHYFPKNGYTACDQLHGNPTIWFTDWVKNPAWCVKGKDREWVFEQARIAVQSGTPRTNTKQ